MDQELVSNVAHRVQGAPVMNSLHGHRLTLAHHSNNLFSVPMQERRMMQPMKIENMLTTLRIVVVVSV